MDNHIFRSALNGFNRQDVMEYIERTQKEAGENAAALEAEIADLRRSEDETLGQLKKSRQKGEELSEQLSDMTERCETARKNWEEHAAAAAALRTDVQQRDATIRELTRENQDLIRRIREMEEQLASARREKEQVAQLELEARERSADVIAQAENEGAVIVAQAKEEAQSILTAAQARTSAMHNEMMTHLMETAAKQEELITQFNASAVHVTSELRKMDVSMAQLPLTCNHLREQLKSLLEKAENK